MLEDSVNNLSNDVPWYMGYWAAFDLETTAVDAKTARIVSASVVVFDTDGNVASKLDWLANPGVDIPAAAAEVHGITNEIVQRDGRDIVAVVGEIVSFLGQIFTARIPVVVYNAVYDFTVLECEANRHGLVPLAVPAPIFDPLVIDKALDKFRKGKRTLAVVCEHYGVTLDNAHSAFDDAYAAGLLALALMKTFPEELEIMLYDLYSKQVEWFKSQSLSYLEYLRKRSPEATVNTGWPILD